LTLRALKQTLFKIIENRFAEPCRFSFGESAELIKNWGVLNRVMLFIYRNPFFKLEIWEGIQIEINLPLREEVEKEKSVRPEKECLVEKNVLKFVSSWEEERRYRID
jgi:hypothetical protein